MPLWKEKQIFVIQSHLLCSISNSPASTERSILHSGAKAKILPAMHSGTCVSSFSLISKQFKYKQDTLGNTIIYYIKRKIKLSPNFEGTCSPFISL